MIANMKCKSFCYKNVEWNIRFDVQWFVKYKS